MSVNAYKNRIGLFGDATTVREPPKTDDIKKYVEEVFKIVEEIEHKDKEEWRHWQRMFVPSLIASLLGIIVTQCTQKEVVNRVETLEKRFPLPIDPGTGIPFDPKMLPAEMPAESELKQ